MLDSKIDADVSSDTAHGAALDLLDSKIDADASELDEESVNEGGEDEGGQDAFAIPAYEGIEVVSINSDVPDFANEHGTDEYVKFSELDALGRAGVAIGCIGPSILATEERESIGMIKPAGWHTVKYDFIDGHYLYNRCHLIAYSLCGVNADERNLITGTRFLNIVGMLDVENRVYWYVRDTGNHVYYRVTPWYEGDNLLATGVQIEAFSVEDEGRGICINSFCFNMQPGVIIDLATGDNELDMDYVPERGIVPNFENVTEQVIKSEGPESQSGDTDQGSSSEVYVPGEDVTYVLNTNTMRFHLPDCPSVQDTMSKNRKEFFGTREELIDAGYKPCGRCHP